MAANSLWGAAHATFAIERQFTVSPARVYAAWVEHEARQAWMVGPEDDLETDVRVGGVERATFGGGDGASYEDETRYLDIVPGQRIVFVYTMMRNGTLLSTSLATVEFADADGTTRMRFTEQGVYLDGADGSRDRRTGWGGMFDRLEAALVPAD
ncbi:MAG: SRPBCC domain-containing protein [Pseudomonadota bacterium]